MLKVALLHFCFTEYTIQLVNDLVNHVNLTLIQPEKIFSTYRSVLDPAVQVVCFKKPRIRDLHNIFSMREVMKTIKDVQPDVLHVQEANDVWYDLMLLLNKMPPLVTTIHDVFRHPGDRDLIIGSEYTRRISYYRSRHLIVHAQFIKNILDQEFNIPQHRISVLPHGELGSLYQRLADKRKPEREPYTLLFFGRIWQYKGLKYLIEALSFVAERIPNVKLIIAGRGEEMTHYFPNGYDPDRYEILNNFIPPETVAGLFQRSTAVVLPYVESSQSGVAAIACATGTPIIASNVGGLGEMIRHEKEGLLVPPGDAPALAKAIVRLLSDHSLQRQIQSSALTRCQEDLNWSNIAAQTVEIYQKICFESISEK